VLKTKKIKYGKKTIFNMPDGILTSCNVACGSGIVMSIFKMADLSHLGLYGSNNGFFGKPS